MNRTKFKVLRITNNLNQKELGEKLGVSSQYISMIEQGKANGSFKFWENFKKAFNISNEEIEKEFAGKGYGDFKTAVGEAVVEELRPIRENFEMYMKDPAMLKELMNKGSDIATRISQRTLDKTMKKIGYVLK